MTGTPDEASAPDETPEGPPEQSTDRAGKESSGEPESRTSSPEEAAAAGGTSDSPPAQGEGRADSH